MLHDLIVSHGMDLIVYVSVILGGLLSRFVWEKIRNETLRGVLHRFYDELTSAVMEVGQVYVDALKAGKADGKLTPEEAAEAKRKALDTFKSNFGKKGLARLARVLKLEDVEKWLSTKVEAVVAQTKTSTPDIVETLK